MSPIGSPLRASAWSGRASALAALGLLAAALALYAGSHRYPLVFDDLQIPTPGTRMEFGELDRRWLPQASYMLVYAIFGADLAWQRFAISCARRGGAALFRFHGATSRPCLATRALADRYFGALAFVCTRSQVRRRVSRATLDRDGDTLHLLCLWCVWRGCCAARRHGMSRRRRLPARADVQETR